MELWQRFTHRARRAILIAHDEASQRQQALIGTEHLLLGLIRLGEGLAADILREMGVDLDALREEIDQITPIGEAERPSREISFTPEARGVLQTAYGQARDMGDDHIGTEHILLGLLREARGPAFRALQKHDVTTEAVLETNAERVPAEGGETPPAFVEPGGRAGGAEQVALAARELLRRAHEAAADMRGHLEKAEGLLEEIADLAEQEYAREEHARSDIMDRQPLSSNRISPAVGPYSQAMRAEGLIFCSGVVGLDPDTEELVQETFEAEVRRVMENLSLLLEDCGSGLNQVVKTTVFLADMQQFGAFNKIYAEYFDDAPPARSTVEAAALPLGARIEVEAIAIA
ncbi:MAG: Rid family detoxifying hydrolase [Armatimonadota bacterium]